MKTAVIIPWRKGETELAATVESATAGLPKRAKVYTVEDTTGAGPARTRHRGIEAATDADVIVIVDAHMRFRGRVLADMAREVYKHGGLLCAKCYHNPECSFDSAHPSGASYYAGAEVHYKGVDQNGQQALVWKWSSDGKPGPRACIGGACYVFRRDWYYTVGQPLAALPAWGCDEEALSISAWLSGDQPAVFDGDVAHRWRPRPPWSKAERPLLDSRAALIAAVASAEDRRDLEAWQGVKRAVDTAEVERWRVALRKQPRTWAQWKAAVPVMTPAAPVQARPPAVVTTILPGAVECNKCGAWNPPDMLPVKHTYPNGNTLVECGYCGKRFVRLKDRLIARA